MKIKLAALIILACSVPAHAMVITDLNDMLIWQAGNPAKPSAKHTLSDKLAAPILNYTKAKGPVHVSTRYRKAIDKKCAVIEVLYNIENTLTRNGQYVTYNQPSLSFACTDGGKPDIKPNIGSVAAFMDQIARDDMAPFMKGGEK